MSVAAYKEKRGVSQFERRLKNLARQSALCNSDKTSVMDGKLYPPFNEGFPTHQNRRCMYFEKYVLPSDPKLEADYWAIFKGGKVGESARVGDCKRCEKPFDKAAKNQIYCTHCRDYIAKDRKKRYYHERKNKE